MALDRPEAVPVSVPAPPKPLGFWRSYRTARRNVLEVVPEPAYREPVVSGGRGAGWIMVMDPPWIEHVLRAHEANYPRSAVAMRILKPREGDNLLTADPPTRRWQRRAMRWIPRPGRIHGSRPPPLELLVDRAIRVRLRDGPSNPPDMLDALIAARDSETGRSMDAVELRNNLLAFPGRPRNDALALTWSLYLLAFDRDVQERARTLAQEVLGDRAATSGDLERLGCVRQVIEEVLRLYPPAALLRRRAAEDDRIADRPVQAGTLVMLPIYALHRHALLWERPKAFDPDRFLPEAARGRHRFSYLPFGAGSRACIGSKFAMMEATIVLATLLARFSFGLPYGSRPRPRMWLTLRPAGGMPLLVEKA